MSEIDIQVIAFFPNRLIEKFNQSNQVGYADGLLVFPANFASQIVQASGNNPRIIEKLLDFPESYLENQPIQVGIPAEQVKNLRIPSGNEQIYSDLENHWIPGGKRSTGVPEAIIDAVAWDKVFYLRIEN